MLDHIEDRLEPVPKPKGDSVMLLSDVIGKTGAQEIAAAGRISFSRHTPTRTNAIRGA
jgi:hypothetical protein